MHDRRLRALICIVFSAVWLPALAAPSDAVNGATPVVDGAPAAATNAPTREPASSAKPGWSVSGEAAKASVPPSRKSRLKFRTADGTCACTCASGGISESAIQQAEAAMREQAKQ